MAGFPAYAARCPHRRDLSVERRPGNALNIEIGTPLPRCVRQAPADIAAAGLEARWILSGGDLLIFGACGPAACPLKPRHCHRCGHMQEHHDWPGCGPGCNVGGTRGRGCDCEGYEGSAYVEGVAPHHGEVK